MGKPRAEEVYSLEIPTDFEMDSWTREVIKKAASRPSGASRRVRILAARYERDDAYRRIQRTWHRRLGWLIGFLMAYWLFGGVLITAILGRWALGTEALESSVFWFVIVGLPILVVLIGYLITGLMAASERGFESYLFRKSLFWIERPEEASALLDAELDSADLTPRSGVRIGWIWKFW